MSDYDELDETDDDNLDFSWNDDTEEPEPEVTPEAATPAPPAATPAVEEEEAPPAEPKLTFEEQLAIAARGSATATSATRDPAARFSQVTLREIAFSDPERYQQLREEGHKLDKLSWGPDR